MKVLYLLLFVCLITSTIAQTDFRPGFVITLGGDTVRGEIDYRSNTKNYQSCKFRKDGAMSEYTPEQLAGYQYDHDKCYVSGVVEGFFAEVLVTGEMSLYLLKNEFYLLKKGRPLYKLEEPMEEVKVNGVEGRIKNRNWVGMTRYLMADCSPDAGVLERIRLNEKALTRLVVQYNTCKGLPFVVYKTDKPWTRVEPGIAVGVVHSSISVKNALVMPYLARQYRATSPSVGLVLAISAPRLSEKFAFQLETHLSKFQYSSLVVDRSSGYTEYYDTSIDLTTLSIPFGIRYSLTDRKYKTRLLAGLTYDFQLKPETRVIHETVAGNTVSTSENAAFEVLSNQVGYTAGMSVARAFEKLVASLSLRYLTMVSLSNDRGLTARPQKFLLTLQFSRR